MISMDLTPTTQAIRKLLTEQKELIPQAMARTAGRLAWLRAHTSFHALMLI